jgi:hypothetical protein
MQHLRQEEHIADVPLLVLKRVPPLHHEMAASSWDSHHLA